MKLEAWILTVSNKAHFFKASLKPCVAGICMHEGIVVVVVDFNFTDFARKFRLPKLKILSVCSDTHSFALLFFFSGRQMQLMNDCGIRIEMVFLRDLIWMLLRIIFVQMVEGNVMVKRITRGPQTWVCILSPLFASQVALHKSLKRSKCFFILHFFKFKMVLIVATPRECCERQMREVIWSTLCLVRCMEVLNTCWLSALCLGYYYYVLVTPGFSERTVWSLEIVQGRAWQRLIYMGWSSFVFRNMDYIKAVS